MKKVILCCTLLALTFASCTKKQSTTLPSVETDTIFLNNPIKPLDTTVIISGIKDINTVSWADFSLPLSIMHLYSPSQKVSMTVEGFPENVKAEWSSVSGITNFNTNLNLKVRFAKPGSYPLTISSYTEKGKTTDYTVNFVIDTQTKRQCNKMFYNMSLDSPFAFLTTDLQLDSIIPSNTFCYHDALEDKLYMSNILLSFDKDISKWYYVFNGNTDVEFTLDCTNGTISIPKQEVVGNPLSGTQSTTFSLWGSGQYLIDEGIMRIFYTTEHDNNGTTVTKRLKMDIRMDK